MYPSLHAVREGLAFLYQLTYLLEGTPYFSPSLHMLQQRIVRVTGQELVRTAPRVERLVDTPGSMACLMGFACIKADTGHSTAGCTLFRCSARSPAPPAHMQCITWHPGRACRLAIHLLFSSTCTTRRLVPIKASSSGSLEPAT